MNIINIENWDDLVNLSKGNNGYGTAEELLEVNLNVDLDYNKISPSDKITWQGLMAPSSTAWNIIFNGNNHKISNINLAVTSNWGFITSKNTGTIYIYDLTLDNISVHNNHTICGLCYTTSDKKIHIENCHITGELSSNYDVYGLVNYSTNVLRSSFSGFLKSNSSIYGIARTGTIDECYFNGTVNLNKANTHIYGIGGSTIYNSYFIGKINDKSETTTGKVALSLSKCYYCYMVLKNAAEVMSKHTNDNSICSDGSISTFWDNSFGELESDTSRGVPTSDLKNKEWLEKQGFAVV